jgi:hypothetical protein
VLKVRRATWRGCREMEETMEYTGQELVSYGKNVLSVSGQNLGNSGGYVGDFPPVYYPVYDHYFHNWYPTYSVITEKSKVERGFKIVGKMLENKIITKELTIKEFIKLVNDIAEIL